MDLISRGVRNRHVRETHMNVQSSRSHSVFTMRVECRATDSSCDVAAVRFGTLHFVDLAGSERTKDTGAAGAAMREAQHINQSLSTLRRIIHQVRVPRQYAFKACILPCSEITNVSLSDREVSVLFKV